VAGKASVTLFAEKLQFDSVNLNVVDYPSSK